MGVLWKDRREPDHPYPGRKEKLSTPEIPHKLNPKTI
jgi:hypothetical protein